MAPPKHRGALNNAFEVCVGLGVLAANLINFGTNKLHSDLGWRLSLLLAAAPASILTAGALLLPETPNSLLQRTADPQRASKMLQRIRGTPDVDDELDDIIAAAKASQSARTASSDVAIMRRRYRPQLVMAFAIPSFQQLTGINVITFYSPVIFRTIGLGESSSLLSTVLTGVTGTVFVVIAMILVDRIGRRRLFLVGGIQMFVTHVAVGAVLAAQLGDSGSMGRGYAYLVLVMVCAYIAGFAISWGPLGWLVPSEIMPLEIRSAGQSLVVAVGLLFAFALAQTLLALLCRMRAGVFFFFAGWVLVMTVFVLALLPETKGLPIEQVERMWHRHWFWKRFVGEEEGEREGQKREALER